MMTSFLTRAMMATISSTALPNEAFRRPPIVSPVLCLCQDLHRQLEQSEDDLPQGDFLCRIAQHGSEGTV